MNPQKGRRNVPTVKQAKQRLTGVKGHVAIDIWQRDDIMQRAEQLGAKLSNEDADNILDDIDRRQDCELGITWDTLDCYIQEYVYLRDTKPAD
jgi:hypothetical protein